MRNKRAFSLIELMVAVAIIVLLISLLLPVLSNAREMAITTKCQSHLSSIGTAFASYASQNNGLMPQSLEFGVEGWDAPGSPPVKGGLLLSWPEALYIDGDVATGEGNRRGKKNNNASWHYPVCWEKLFTCPKHDAQYQWGSDGPASWGYGMAWMATSRFPDALYIRWSDLNPAHIVASDGLVFMGRTGAYASPPNNSIYGVFERHLKGKRLGANYVMGDGHVEYSDTYGSYTSPLWGGTPNAAQSVPPTNIWVHP